MPSIAGIDLTDGIKILLGRDKNGVVVAPVHYNATNLANYLASHTIAQTENTVNNFLANYLQSDQVRVHIFSVSPLRYTCLVADPGVTIPPDWWLGL
jgi:hypothetical protein